MSPDAISCEQHDYIEVACLYGYQLKLILKDKQTIEGKAIDIINSVDKGECLVIDDDINKQHVVLTQLAILEVTTPNAKFREVIF